MPVCTVLCFLVGLLLISTARSHGQTQPPRRSVIQRNGLQAIDRSLVASEPRTPRGSGSTALQQPLVESRTIDRVGSSGAPYRPGRVIVKFRGGVSSTLRLNTLSQMSRSAAMAPRPASANFDIVNIDQAEDAEAVARAFSQRGDVEYAQPAHRIRARFVPNDPSYGLQWNFPQIDLERAWDVQKGGSSSLIVAVLDSGMAFETVTLSFRGFAYTSDQGVNYPALGIVSVPFARATDLAASGSAGDAAFLFGRTISSGAITTRSTWTGMARM